MDSKHAKRKREEKKNQQEKKSRLELTNSSKVYFEKVSRDPSMYFRVNFFHISLLASLSVLGHLSCSFSKSFPYHLLFDKQWVWQVNCFQLSGSMWWCFKPFNLISDQHLISPYNITPESHIKVMRMKEMITK